MTYNAKSRPTRFESADGATVIDCTYDYMGRRHTRKVTVNGTVSNYLRYIYRGYLQIAAIDAISGVFRWFLFWDPTQPTATRPLAIRKDSTWYAYGWDLTKNVTEIFGKAGYLRTAYTYTPYGEATATGDVTQPITWSSEYADDELALIYYNYRHYNPADGRWICRDRIHEKDSLCEYNSFLNNAIIYTDHIGNNVVLIVGGVDIRPEGIRDHDLNQFNFRMAAALKIEELCDEKPNEVFEVFLETKSYKLRNEQEPSKILQRYRWNQKREYYSDIFYHNPNVVVREINNTNELSKALQCTKDGRKRIKTTLISELYYYGHGEVGSLGIQYPFDGRHLRWMLSINDIKKIFKKHYFTKNPYIELITCHSASTSKKRNIKKSLAEELSHYLGGVVKGMHGRVDYGPMGEFFISKPDAPKPGTSVSSDVDKFQGKIDWRIYINGVLQKKEK